MAQTDKLMSKPETVGRYKVVSMQYSLTNTDGVVVREATGVPVTYLHGAGLLFPKLENELESHTIGDIVTARLLPDDAFGKRNIDLVHQVPLNELPSEDNIEIGGKIVGSDEDGNEVTFTVTGIEGGIVSLDGNHPFAGQSLVFEIEIQAIRDATEEEIRQQKVIG
jgi:FKBP-type peptidyl-prolyl cis-trans isomerase SlyD